MSKKSIHVLIVDDTVVYRRILSDIVNKLPDTTITAAVANGQLALNRLKNDPVDLVLLDVEMPVMGGLETLKVIRREYPDIGVIMVSGTNKNAAGVTIEALDEGALDFVPKPEGAGPEESRRLLGEQLGRLFQLFSTRRALRGLSDGKPTERRVATPEKRPLDTERRSTIRRSQDVTPTERPPQTKSPLPTKVDVVVIGVSTGGPNALAHVIPKLPADLGVPVLVVQHMPPLFTASLAESLDKKSNIHVAEAQENSPLKPNEVLIAQGGKHMLIRKSADGQGYMVGLNENPPENNCRPAVDVLFRSAATHFGNKALALIMTGMGEDGCKGVRVMKRQGSYCLTQDADSCVVYGMPRAIADAGLSDEVVTLDSLADRITRIVRRAAA